MIDDRCCRSVFRIDSSSIVVIESVSIPDSTRNWSIFINFSFHLSSTNYFIVIRYEILSIRDSSAILFSIIRRGYPPWSTAIFANINWIALVFIQICCLIVLATCIWHSFLIGIYINSKRIATIACSTSSAIDDGLRTESQWSGAQHVCHNIESIS